MNNALATLILEHDYLIAENATLTAEVAQLRELLRELVQDERAMYTYDYQFCSCCLSENTYSKQQKKLLFPHTPDCLVVRARAALAEDTPPHEP